MFHTLERAPSKGYQLLNLGSHWELHSPSGVFKGDLKKICTYAVVKLGFPFKELEIAVDEMEKRFNEGHNAAEFGIYKSFVFTFRIKRETVH